MSIWSAATINRFVAEGEQEIAKGLNCLINRVSLDITEGQVTVQLPSDLLSIERITWLGKRLDPMPLRDFQKINVIAGESLPLFYIFNQQGQNTVRFFPLPPQAVAADDSGLWGPTIGTTIICAYWQLPDTVSVQIPQYIRLRLIKYYVLWKCFAIEGAGQNLKSSVRFKKRYDFYMEWFKKIHASHYVAKMSVLGTGNKRGILAPPRLPYTFGESGEY